MDMVEKIPKTTENNGKLKRQLIYINKSTAVEKDKLLKLTKMPGVSPPSVSYEEDGNRDQSL